LILTVNFKFSNLFHVALTSHTTTIINYLISQQLFNKTVTEWATA